MAGRVWEEIRRRLGKKEGKKRWHSENLNAGLSRVKLKRKVGKVLVAGFSILEEVKGFMHPVRATYATNSCRFNVHLADETGTIVATVAENMFCVTQYLKENTHEIKTVRLLMHQQFNLNHHHKSRKQPFQDESSSASMEDDNLPLAVAFIMKKKNDYKQPSENTFLRR